MGNKIKILKRNRNKIMLRKKGKSEEKKDKIEKLK